PALELGSIRGFPVRTGRSRKPLGAFGSLVGSNPTPSAGTEQPSERPFRVAACRDLWGMTMSRRAEGRLCSVFRSPTFRRDAGFARAQLPSREKQRPANGTTPIQRRRAFSRGGDGDGQISLFG